MAEYGPETYGERIADLYDVWHAETAAGQIERIASLAGDGPVLELAIGTGRIALPLARRGIEVHGIDASPSMIERLRAKPGGEELPVAVGDFADVDIEGPFSLVFVVFNTFFALLTQDDQVRCFENVARRLLPGGHFLIEAFVPDQGRFDRGQRVSVTGIEGDEVRLEVSRHDPVRQRSTTRHLVVGPGGIRSLPVQARYAFPAELDLMGRLAGLSLSHRWGGWNEEPFDAGSTSHVSVWEKPAATG